MEWLIGNLQFIVGALLLISEGAAALSQLLFPGNSGFNGFLAAVVKFLQKLKS